MIVYEFGPYSSKSYIQGVAFQLWKLGVIYFLILYGQLVNHAFIFKYQ
jgi:hypothetical protein